MDEGPAPDLEQQPKLDASVAHSARVWDYWLGGKDNFAADRAAGEQVRAVLPDIVDAARVDRGFLVRAVRHLAGEVGMRQFLDVGSGLPTANNTHQVAQSVAPECRVLYVDNDPMVLAHARALLTSGPHGRTDYIDADIRDSDRILREATRTLDLDRPVVIMLLGIVQFIVDTGRARAIVHRFLDAVPPGSYLVLAHPASGFSDAVEAAIQLWNTTGGAPQVLRTAGEVAGFLDGLELLDPGVVSCPRWRPDPADPVSDLDVAPWRLCGVGRKL
jgi:hypothetical protein